MGLFLSVIFDSKAMANWYTPTIIGRNEPVNDRVANGIVCSMDFRDALRGFIAGVKLAITDKTRDHGLLDCDDSS